MAIEIVDLPINSMVIFPSVMIQRLPGRVKGKSAGISHGFSHEDHGDYGGKPFSHEFPWYPATWFTSNRSRPAPAQVLSIGGRCGRCCLASVLKCFLQRPFWPWIKPWKWGFNGISMGFNQQWNDHLWVKNGDSWWWTVVKWLVNSG